MVLTRGTREDFLGLRITSATRLCYLNHVRTRKVNIGTRDCDRVPPIDTVTNNFTQLFDQFSLIVLLMSPVLVTAYIITQRLD